MYKSEKEKQILDLLMSRKDIRKLVEKSNECYSKMDFVGAMRYRQEIKDIVDRESKIMLTKSESLIGLMNNADNEYKFNMLVWLHSMMCMADVFSGGNNAGARYNNQGCRINMISTHPSGSYTQR